MTRRSTLLVVLAFALSGCASATQIAQRDEDRCAARGHKPDTKEFETCMSDLETARAVRRNTRHQEMVERSSSPLSR